MFTTLVSTETLLDHLYETDWVIVDCRFDLANPAWGKEAYQTAHIPGAVYTDLNNDLSSPITEETGRHPLPTETSLQKLFSAMGIEENTQVVVYDQTGGSYAARLWWLLQSMGHNATAVLDGGLSYWAVQNYPTRAGNENRKPTPFEGTLFANHFVDAAEVDRIRLNPNYRLVDARTSARFRGDEEPIDAIPGHIPGAINRFHGLNLQTDGRFLTANDLRQQFHDLLGEIPPERTVVYCGSGVTSCHHLLAMRIAGLMGARLYPGSWSEWIRDPNRPIGTGDA